MDYLNTRSPVSRSQLEALFRDVATFKPAKIDGGVLSNLLKLCYFSGLRKAELIGLRIRDVAEKGVVKEAIHVGGQAVVLSPDAKRLIEHHIDYLRKSGYGLYPSWPLFPSRAKAAYTAKTLQNHLSKFFSATPGKVTLDKIRKAAVCHFYDHLKKSGERPRPCLEKTADFARLTLRSTENLLLDQIQPTGARANPAGGFGKYLKEIETLEHRLLASESPKDRGERDAICRQIENDPDLSDDEKDALKNCLNTAVTGALNRPSAQNESSPKPTRESLFEAIKRLKP